MQEKYKIAEHVFRIDTIYAEIHKLCRSYRSGEPEEFFIHATEKDIENEKKLTADDYARANIPLIALPEWAYESVAVYRKIVSTLFPYDIMLCHGSAVAVDGSAYMFIAKSGTGKSTHTRMWRDVLGSRAVMVNDDKPLIRIGEKQTVVYGTPWNGKHNLGNNIAVPLRSICILKRGNNNNIRRIGILEAYPMLLQQTYRIHGKENMAKAMDLIDTMGKNVRFYTMECNISTEAAEMAYKTMSEGETLQ